MTFNINTAQVNDKVTIEVKGQEVTATITKIEPHSINFDIFKVYVTTDSPVAVWNDKDIRTRFCVSHDVTGERNQVTNII